MVARGGSWAGVGEMGEGGQKVQTSSYKISHEDIMYSIVNIVNNTVLNYLKVVKTVKLSSQEEKRIKIFVTIFS